MGASSKWIVRFYFFFDFDPESDLLDELFESDFDELESDLEELDSDFFLSAAAAFL